MSTRAIANVVQSLALLLVTAGAAYGASSQAAEKPVAQPAQPAQSAQPPENAVRQPDTDRAMSSSGAMVPGQPIRPEGPQEATVPKTQMDKTAATSSDVGTDQVNEKSTRAGSGGDGSLSPNR